MDHREPTAFEDWHAINTLLMTYAEHVDAGRYKEVGAMFEHAAYRIKHADGAILMGPMEVPGGSRIVQATDPQGAHFALVKSKL